MRGIFAQTVGGLVGALVDLWGYRRARSYVDEYFYALWPAFEAMDADRERTAAILTAAQDATVDQLRGGGVPIPEKGRERS